MDIIKTLTVLLFIMLPLAALGDDEGVQTDFGKPYVGFNMPLSADMIQIDPTCNKKPFYFGGSSYDWLNSDKVDASSVLFKQTER